MSQNYTDDRPFCIKTTSGIWTQSKWYAYVIRCGPLYLNFSLRRNTGVTRVTELLPSSSLIVKIAFLLPEIGNILQILTFCNTFLSQLNSSVDFDRDGLPSGCSKEVELSISRLVVLADRGYGGRKGNLLSSTGSLISSAIFIGIRVKNAAGSRSDSVRRDAFLYTVYISMKGMSLILDHREGTHGLLV